MRARVPAGSESLLRLRSLRQVTAYMTPDRSTRHPRCPSWSPSHFALSGQLPILLSAVNFHIASHWIHHPRDAKVYENCVTRGQQAAFDSGQRRRRRQCRRRQRRVDRRAVRRRGQDACAQEPQDRRSKGLLGEAALFEASEAWPPRCAAGHTDGHPVGGASGRPRP